MIYEGEEFLNRTRPDIFDRDCIWEHRQGDLSDFIAKCAQIKKEVIPTSSIFSISCDDEQETAFCIHMALYKCVYGFFSLGSSRKSIRTEFLDGDYKNLITDNTVQIIGGYVTNEQEVPFVTVLDSKGLSIEK